MNKSNYPTNVIVTGKTYLVGTKYKATANHIIEALMHGVKIPLDGLFVCSFVDNDGSCWSKDASLLNDDEDPSIKDVGIMCAPAGSLEEGNVRAVS